eukprot:gene10247-10405_t
MLQGYLLKANREYRKTNLIGGKYKKRWVELTVDTLVYAGSQQELLTGKIQVFSVHELLWVCAEGTAKFKVKFPERALIFKVESGSSAERDKWVAALEGAKQAKSRATQQLLGAEKLEQLQKQNQSIVPRRQIPPCNMNSNCSPQNSNSKQADPPVEECSGSESPRTSLKRANLARRVTPGVLLIPPRSPSAQTTPTTSGDQLAALALSSTCGSGWTAAEQLTLQQPDHHSSASATLPVGGRQDEQILTLDPSEGSTQQRGAPYSIVAGSPQGSLSSTSAGPAQGSRPGSAQYRPGPPLKSCLRQSGSAPQLAMLLGSASSPTSSAAAMAAAVDDAEGSGGWSHSNGNNSNSGRRCQSSPLGRQPSPAKSHKLSDKSLEPDRRDWLQDDWDEDSASSSCSGDDHDDGNGNDGCSMVAAAVKGGKAQVSSTAQVHSKQAADAVLQVAGRGAVQGVRADENWLADDFDDDN